MNQRGKGTDRVLSKPCTSPVALAIPEREASPPPAAQAGSHAFHQKLIHSYLDAYGT
jgi:hypothetical protein